LKPELLPVLATDGDIAAINAESARRRAWARFEQEPRLPGNAESVVDKEQIAAQFFGDLDALDRLENLATRFARVEDSWRADLVQAQVASAVHRFENARLHLERASGRGAPREEVERHSLTLDQASGVNLDAVLAARHRIALKSGKLEDLVPLGALLADLDLFDKADSIYRQAFNAFTGSSPFPPAWVSFQLGVLWGELVPEPDLAAAAHWYRRALDYLPGYVKARVHLAETFLDQDRAGDAAALLEPALQSRDPEVRWRLAEALAAQQQFGAAQLHLEAAREGFEQLLRKHPLAFADHAADFYASGGNDRPRAYELARVNAMNRPTRRAIAQLRAIEIT